jgi:hypothetical protein
MRGLGRLCVSLIRFIWVAYLAAKARAHAGPGPFVRESEITYFTGEAEV